MKFAYMTLPLRPGAATLPGLRVRRRPIVPIRILAPVLLPLFDACIDCASDDTVFPPQWAARLGVNAKTAPKGQASGIGGTVVNVSYAPVTLLLSDGYESCQWDATVAFSAVPMRLAAQGATDDAQAQKEEISECPGGLPARVTLQTCIITPKSSDFVHAFLKQCSS